MKEIYEDIIGITAIPVIIPLFIILGIKCELENIK